MRIGIHAGHNPDGKIACGAIGYIKESTEARKVTKEVIALLRAKGHTVYDCTCNNGISQMDVLRKIVARSNAHALELTVSIHFNALGKTDAGNDRTTGTEVLICSETTKAKPYAERVVKSIAKLGYTNRGVKIRRDLYFLNHTSAPAILIECCFVNDKDDVEKYNYKTMAQAIANGILS